MSEEVITDVLDTLLQSGVAEDLLSEDVVTAFFDALQESGVDLSECSSDEIAGVFDQFCNTGNVELSDQDLGLNVNDNVVSQGNADVDPLSSAKARLNHNHNSQVSFGRTCEQKCVDNDVKSGLCRWG